MKFHPCADIFPLMQGAEFEGLVSDIKANGLRQPIVLYQDKILDGRNRWNACEKAGVEPKTKNWLGDDPLAYVISLNLTRRHLSESQRAMVGANIATMKQGTRTDLGQICTKSAAEAAALVNVSERSVKSARAVKDSGTPELIEAVERDEIAVSVAADLARAPASAQRAAVKGGHTVAKSIARKLKQEKGEKRLTEKLEKLAAVHAEALPDDRRYSVIYADPPWRYEHAPMGDEDRSIEANYPTMSIEEICALPVGTKISAEDSILFLWATSPMLAKAIAVVSAWGFEYTTCFVWIKDKIGMGYFARQRHELLLVAKRGNMPAPAVAARHDSVVEAPRGRHSEKPDVFRKIIEKMYSGVAKIELFAREAPEGWATWGGEA